MKFVSPYIYIYKFVIYIYKVRESLYIYIYKFVSPFAFLLSLRRNHCKTEEKQKGQKKSKKDRRKAKRTHELQV